MYIWVCTKKESYLSATVCPAWVLGIRLRSKAAVSPSIAPQPASRACLAMFAWLCSWLVTALPMISGSQEVSTSLAGSAPSMENHPSYSFEKWMDFCSFKRPKQKLAVWPYWAMEMNSFLESICNSKMHLTQNRAWGIVAKQEASTVAWSLHTSLNRDHAPQSRVAHFSTPEVKADFTSPLCDFFPQLFKTWDKQLSVLLGLPLLFREPAQKWGKLALGWLSEWGTQSSPLLASAQLPL